MVVIVSPNMFVPGTVVTKIRFDPYELNTTSQNIAVGMLTFMVLAIKTLELKRYYETSRHSTMLFVLFGFSLMASSIVVCFLAVQFNQPELKLRMSAFLCAWLAQFTLASAWFIHRMYNIADSFGRNQDRVWDEEVLRSITTIIVTMAVGSAAVVGCVGGYLTVNSLVWLTLLVYLAAEVIYWGIYLAMQLNFAHPRLYSLFYPSRFITVFSLIKLPGLYLMFFVAFVISGRVLFLRGKGEHMIIIVIRAFIYVILAMGHTIAFTNDPDDYFADELMLQAIFTASRLNIYLQRALQLVLRDNTEQNDEVFLAEIEHTESTQNTNDTDGENANS